MTYSPLTWADVDPYTHPFDSDDAREFINPMIDEIADRFPKEWLDYLSLPLPADYPGSTPFSNPVKFPESMPHQDRMKVQSELRDTIGAALTRKFGRWIDAEMSRPGHGNFVSPRQAAERIHRSVCETRQWVETLADRFGALALPAAPPHARLAALEHAVTELVTLVVEQTEAWDCWYDDCAIVLGWFLEHQGVDCGDFAIDELLNGRFDSWIAPAPELVADVAAEFALRLEDDE